MCTVYILHVCSCREHGLNKSCDDLPCCLVYRQADNKEVVGFSQVVAVQGKDKACLVESGKQ